MAGSDKTAGDRFGRSPDNGGLRTGMRSCVAMRLISCFLLLIQIVVQLLPQVLAESGSTIFEQTIESPSSGTGSVESAASHSSEASTGLLLPVASASSESSSSYVFSEASASQSSSFVPNPNPIPVRVVITELAWMGSDLSTADEWVEIAAFASGSTSLPRSVDSWTLLSVKAGVETVIARLPAFSLASGSVLVIANNSAAVSRMMSEPTVVTTGMSLPNTQLLLRLRDGSGTLIDEVDDGVGSPFAGANPSGGGPKATMQRADPWKAGNMQLNWKTATDSCGWDEGVPVFGSPGRLSCVDPSIPQSSSSAASSSVSASGSSMSSISSASGASLSFDSSAPASAESSGGAGSSSPIPSIRLTEILANPVGVDNDEWVEIGSFDTSVIDLAEITLKTGTLRFALSGLLQPGEHRRFGKLLTGLPLPNSSGVVELLWRDRGIDTFSYTETAEGVSVSRLGDGSVTAACVPTPDAPNTLLLPDPHITVQSSNATSGKLTLNLETTMVSGSMAGAACSWSYPDGYTSLSCNPPSHSMPGPIVGDIFMSLKDYCGNTVTRTLHVDVAGILTKKEDGESSFLCTPSAFTGVVVSEVLPNPMGEDADGEWIELWNPSAVEKPLCGWSLDDDERGSAPYRLDHLRLPAGDRLLFSRKDIELSLNNDRDAIRLFAPLPMGGSGAIEIVRYAAAPEGQSFARRDDGVWLWTDPTPAAANAFATPTWPATILARIIQAMPNPSGKDTDGGEWIEVKNETRFPLPLTGWSLETASDSHSLDGIILVPRERKRLEMSSDTLTLANTNGFVRLVDRFGVPLSTLAWVSAKDGQSIVIPTSIQTMTGAIFMGSSDCVTWQVERSDGRRDVLTLSSVETTHIIECTQFVSDLLENEKFEQQIYSEDGSDSAVFVRGTNIAELLLRHGLVVRTAEAVTVHDAQYRVAEDEARIARRGLWASNEYTSLLEESRTLALQRDILKSDGLQIHVSKEGGIVQKGDLLTVTTNVPATMMLAIGTGADIPYVGPIVLDRDMTVRMTAVSEVQTLSGFSVTSNSIQSYALLKSTYPKLAVSEVYPSPAKGESEWVELWNPSDEIVSLVGWTIDDAVDIGSKPAKLPIGAMLLPGERLRFEGLPVAWNNTGDHVRLIAPNGKVTHDMEFASTKTGRAIAVVFGSDGRPMGQCATVQPTPGTENRCVEASAVAKKKASTRKATASASSHDVRYRNVLLEQLETTPIGALFRQLESWDSESDGLGSLAAQVLLLALAAALIGVIAYLRQSSRIL